MDHGVHIGRAGGPPTEGRRAQYCFNQLEILDDTIEQVVYEHVFPQKVLPLIYRKLSTWHVEPHQTTMESYVSLRWCVELTPPEFDRFVQECVGVLADDRAFWIPASYHQGHRWGGGETPVVLTPFGSVCRIWHSSTSGTCRWIACSPAQRCSVLW